MPDDLKDAVWTWAMQIGAVLAPAYEAAGWAWAVRGAPYGVKDIPSKKQIAAAIYKKMGYLRDHPDCPHIDSGGLSVNRACVEGETPEEAVGVRGFDKEVFFVTFQPKDEIELEVVRQEGSEGKLTSSSGVAEPLQTYRWESRDGSSGPIGTAEVRELPSGSIEVVVTGPMCPLCGHPEGKISCRCHCHLMDGVPTVDGPNHWATWGSRERENLVRDLAHQGGYFTTDDGFSQPACSCGWRGNKCSDDDVALSLWTDHMSQGEAPGIPTGGHGSKEAEASASPEPAPASSTKVPLTVDVRGYIDLLEVKEKLVEVVALEQQRVRSVTKDFNELKQMYLDAEKARDSARESANRLTFALESLVDDMVWIKSNVPHDPDCPNGCTPCFAERAWVRAAEIRHGGLHFGKKSAFTNSHLPRSGFEMGPR